MRGVKSRVPLFIQCKRPGCEGVKQVRRVCDQRKVKYCSQRCIAIVTQNIRRAGRKGIEASVRQRQRKVLLRVKGLSPIAAFRLGYVRGLQSKLRQIRRRYVLVRKDRAGDLVRSLSLAVAK